MSLIKKLNQIIAAVLPHKNKQAQPFEKVMFKDRLLRYDEQIEMEYLSLKMPNGFNLNRFPTTTHLLPVRFSSKSKIKMQ